MATNRDTLAYPKNTANDFQAPYIPHRTNVTAADSTFPTLSPNGWNGFTTFKTNGAVTAELRFASTTDTGTTKSLTFKLWAWPYSVQDDTLHETKGGQLHSAGILILDSGLATSGEVITGHPFGAGDADGTVFYMADQEDTVTYEVDGMIKRYPNTVGNAATHELRYLIDCQGYEHLYVSLDGVPAGRTEVGFRRVG